MEMLLGTPRLCGTQGPQSCLPSALAPAASLPACIFQGQSQLEAPLWPGAAHCLTSLCPPPLAAPMAHGTLGPWLACRSPLCGPVFPMCIRLKIQGTADALPAVTARSQAVQGWTGRPGRAVPGSGMMPVGDPACPLARWSWLLRGFPTISPSPASLYSRFQPGLLPALRVQPSCGDRAWAPRGGSSPDC